MLKIKDLIKNLKAAKGSKILPTVILGPLNAEITCLQAAKALEDTLWKPYATMPKELKDGREIVIWATLRPVNRMMRPFDSMIISSWSERSSEWTVSGHDVIEVKQYKVIHAPE